MPYLSRHGTMKPPLGAQIDPTHPFSQQLQLLMLFNEPRGATSGTLPVVDIGWAVTFVGAKRSALSLYGPPTYVSNAQGLAAHMDNSTGFKVADGTFAGTQGTVCVVRRKTDTTNRVSRLFMCGGAGSTDQVSAHCPYSDGVVYWDFGGFGAPNRLSVSGL